ncbi:hypothetical protein ACHAW5_005188 [Stephanodiscus triporus]|uniref:Methyltransferase domain-containing protein n=1 Tax=Stephanodiscus triporus TaxID=2934178 RepID=A0ABD3P6V8_9STRA
MMLRLVIFISVPAIVAPFTHRPSPSHPSTPWSSRRHPSPSQAAGGAGNNGRRGGGAMARRGKRGESAIVRIEDDVFGSDGGDAFDRRTTDDRRPTTTRSSSSSSESSSDGGDIIYSMPPLYDLAFGYRDYVDEVEFLLRAHDEHSARRGPPSSSSSSSSATPLRLLELAAGPARHSLAALTGHPKSRVDSAMALDISRAMVEYGSKNADRDLGDASGGGGGRRDDFHYDRGDMRRLGDYYAGGSFDAAWLLLGSMQHLLSNDDIIACLSSLRYVIKSGGTVVIELPHPRETFRMGECTTNGWTVPLVEGVEGGGGEEREYGELSIVWGEEGDVFDPVSQVRNFSIGLELRLNDVDDIPKDGDSSLLFSKMKADGKTKLKEVVPLRLFTMQEIDALARVAGFELVAKYGALAEDVSIDDEDEAFRMVCVLRKEAE